MAHDDNLIEVEVPGGVNRITRAVFEYYAKPLGSLEEFVTPLQEAMATISLAEIIRRLLQTKPNAKGRHAGTFDGRRMWLAPNRVGGLTLMFPEKRSK